MPVCKQCKKELTTPTAFEDGIYSILISWLNSVTCINWYRLYPDYERPKNENGSIDEQYGMIFISAYEPIQGSLSSELHSFDFDTGTEIERRHCIIFNETENLTIELNVYRESGEAVRALQPVDDNGGVSPANTLKQVNTFLASSEFTQALSTANIKMHRSANISVQVNKIQSIYEWSATAEFTARVCRQVAYPVADDLLIFCVETCDGTPVCITNECEE